VLTQIDVKDTLNKKIGVDFRPYLILGACNPKLAYEALTLEDKIGTMLPCNVVVQQQPGGKVEVSAVDPVASMAAIDNRKLGAVAGKSWRVCISTWPWRTPCSLFPRHGCWLTACSWARRIRR
jgi:uncharacterized protein (DUF302 family)